MSTLRYERLYVTFMREKIPHNVADRLINHILAQVNGAKKDSLGWRKLRVTLRKKQKAVSQAIKRWAVNPAAQAVFIKFESTLSRVDEAIYLAWDTKNPTPLSVYAQEHGLPNGGCAWSDWLQPEVKTKIQAAFDRLYDVTLHPYPFRRFEPFGLPETDDVNARRWRKLEQSALAARERFRQMARDHETATGRPGTPYAVETPLRLVDEALQAYRMHEPGDLAPVQWLQLLSGASIAEFRQWEALTMRGNRMDVQQTGPAADDTLPGTDAFKRRAARERQARWRKERRARLNTLKGD